MRAVTEQWTFPLTNESIEFKNCMHIHPLKQQMVQELISLCKKSKQIKQIIIFGSATEFRCNSASDLDVCIEGTVEKSFFKEFLIKYDVDLFNKNDLNESMRKSVNQTGINVLGDEKDV